MKASYNPSLVSTKSDHNIREKKFLSSWDIVTKEPFKIVVSAKYYKGRSKSASTVYAEVFFGNNRGTGNAKGYGYHNPSAAIADAIKNLGIELSDDINGHGDVAIHNALIAIAKLEYSDTE